MSPAKTGIVAAEAPEEQAQDMPGVPEESTKDVGAGEPKSVAPTEDDGDESANVTPEEQKMYDAVVSAAYSTLYSEQGFQALLQRLKSGADDPAKTIGHTTAMILLSVRKSVEQKGRSVPDDVIFAAGQEIAGGIAEIAVRIGVVDEAKEDVVLQASYFEGVKAFGQSLQDEGKITPDVQQQARKDLADSGKGEKLMTAGPPEKSPIGIEQQSTQPPAGGIANNPVGA